MPIHANESDVSDLVVPMPQVYEFDVSDLVMSATAYYLGRRTANVGDFCRRLCLSWPSLPVAVQQFVERIVEEAYRRAARTDRFALGNDCDRVEWDKVRRCWSEARRCGYAVGDRVRMKEAIMDGSQHLCDKDEVLIVRRVTNEKRPRNGVWPVYVSHEHIADRFFGVMLNQIEST